MLGFLVIEFTQAGGQAASGDTLQDQLQSEAEILQILTPRMMHWDQGVWLLDLTPCASYWSMQAEAQQVEVLDLIRCKLSDMKQILSVQRAVMAVHPWRAFLLITHMRLRGLTGFVSCEEAIGQKLYREVNWSVFWTCVEDLGRHTLLTATDRRKVRGRSLQMQRAVKRLGLKAPTHMQHLTQAAIKRRFGAYLAELWRWTFALSAEDLQTERMLFWRSFHLAPKPQISRHLSESLTDWDSLSPFLIDDFDRLCSLPTWQAEELVVSLEWRLTLHDLSYHCIFIRFRHPHSLHLERGAHKTALLQAFHSFQAAPVQGRNLAVKSIDTDWQWESLPMAIIGWDLTVTQKLPRSSRMLSLFAGTDFFAGTEWQVEDGSTADMLRLENKLLIPLQSYALKDDWLPEDAFVCRKPLNFSEVLGLHEFSLLSAACMRPLFIYKKPLSIAACEIDQNKIRTCFTERTMNKWWQSPIDGDATPLQRDYYRLRLREKSLWVYRQHASTVDSSAQEGPSINSWFVHGIFA